MSSSSYQTQQQQDLEIILLGTGTSGQLPNVSCLTNHLSPNPTPPCRTCLSTLVPEGKKNIRRNTSAVVRGKREDGSKSTILIDCGKSFLSSALEFFPKHGLRQIDAVILTHAHADAINGLDDLRGWTLRGVVQPFIKVYLSAHTLSEIASSWPYMVETSKATGGGDVPAFEWNVIDEEKDFIVEGIRVTPLNVHHGRFFDPPPPAGSPPVDPTLPPPPVKPFYCLGFFFHPSIIYLSDVSFIPEHVWAQMLLPQQEAAAAAEKEKSSSKGMSIEEEMKKASQSIHPPFPSDLSALTPPWSPIISPTPSAHSSHYSSGSSTPTSHLSSSPPTSFAPSPSHTPALSATSTSPSSPTSSSAPNLSSQAASPAAPYQLPLLILDCLFLQSHPSHFGIVPALLTTLRLNPSKTYLTGFAHHHSHAEWETLGKVIEGLPSLPSSEEAEEEEEPILTSARSLLGPKLWSEVVEWGGYVRPAYDGLRVVCPSSSSSSSKRVGELANEEDEDSENEVAVDLAKLGRELEFGGRRSRSSAKTAVGGPKREEGKASEAVAVGGEVGHAERGGCDCP